MSPLFLNEFLLQVSVRGHLDTFDYQDADNTIEDVACKYVEQRFKQLERSLKILTPRKPRYLLYFWFLFLSPEIWKKSKIL